MSWVGVRATLLFLPYFLHPLLLFFSLSLCCHETYLLSQEWLASSAASPGGWRKAPEGWKSQMQEPTAEINKEKQVMKATWAAVAGSYEHLYCMVGCNLFGWTSEVLQSSTRIVNKDGLLNFRSQCERVSGQLMEQWLALSGQFCMYTEICTLIELEQSFIVLWFSVAFYIVVANRRSVVKTMLKLPLESIRIC